LYSTRMCICRRVPSVGRCAKSSSSSAPTCSTGERVHKHRPSTSASQDMPSSNQLEEILLTEMMSIPLSRMDDDIVLLSAPQHERIYISLTSVDCVPSNTDTAAITDIDTDDDGWSTASQPDDDVLADEHGASQCIRKFQFIWWLF